jgi:hypothetical protein
MIGILTIKLALVVVKRCYSLLVALSLTLKSFRNLYKTLAFEGKEVFFRMAS